VPFIKTGGLADVIGSLPKYFDKKKYDVRVFLPKYTCIKQEYRNQMTHLAEFYTDFCNRHQFVGIDGLKIDGIQFYFLDSEFYFNGSWPYTDPVFDIEKFAFFSRNVLSALPIIGFQPDIIHCHDWQSALIPVYLNDSFQGDLFFNRIKTIFTIHNLRFQGMYDVKTVQEHTDLSDYYFTSDKLEIDGAGDLLKGGLVYADRITTVSKTYAKEIQSPEYGERLEGILQAKKDLLSGIVNGIDVSLYNPETDADIAANYTAENAIAMKKLNKAALQKKLSLDEDPDAMLIGIVSRMTDQKGFDLIEYVFHKLINEHVQVVILGTGDDRFEKFFKSYESVCPGKVSAQIYYSESLSHEIYAASDLLLMPSLFEPCGLSQLIALRYGALPLVRETGGLFDTVQPYNEFTNEGTGFSFTYFNADDMFNVIQYALHIFNDTRERWNEMVIRAMNQDFSWVSSAKEYEKLYHTLYLEKKREEKKFSEV